MQQPLFNRLNGDSTVTMRIFPASEKHGQISDYYVVVVSEELAGHKQPDDFVLADVRRCYLSIYSNTSQLEYPGLFIGNLRNVFTWITGDMFYMKNPDNCYITVLLSVYGWASMTPFIQWPPQNWHLVVMIVIVIQESAQYTVRSEGGVSTWLDMKASSK